MSTVLHKLQVEIAANSTKFAQGIKNAQKPMQGFASGLKEFGNQTNIAGHNLGGLATQLTSFVNPATAAAGAVSLIGAAYLNTHAGAEALEEVQFRLEASFEILGREVSSFIDIFNELGSSDGGPSAMDRVTDSFLFLNPLTTQYQNIVKALDIITDGYITRLGEEADALAELKGAYDDLLRDRIIESEQISELERKIEKLKTQRVEENVTTKEKISLDRQILVLEEKRFLLLVADAEKRRQSLEAAADLTAKVTSAMTEEERQQAINNSLNDKQLELLINTRNEVRNLEAEYELRIRKIRKELTGLLEDLGKASSFKFDRSSLKDTGNVNFPGEFQRDTFDQDIADKQRDSIVKETEAILKLGAAYGTLNFNLAQYQIDQENAASAAEKAANDFEFLTGMAENFAYSVASGQQSAVQALGAATIDIVDNYLKQALAAAIAASVSNPLIPLPIGLAAAAVGVAAIKGLFAKSVGSSSSGGGGGGSVSVPTQRADTSRGERIRERPEQIQLGGTIEVNGEKMLVVLKNAGQKSSAKRG
jgi:hypothetical protein